ncbi:helix-turn-helix transcriptional regulator [Govanella unica]|uniref:Helix-turn-helix domain-containing protein n=1 Tax=Govanella unica TaxID=2975056 RepID=A0A9X3TVZ1_9PROT|nr:helix-turn-helix domain-containing protein [Govania unica]MDA5192668.1 helix-turn-helix domain-containing protein [Govania unica]
MELYLTQQEVAEHLRLSGRILERLRLSGAGPAYMKLGRRVLYRQVDIEAWATGRRRTSTSEPV